MVRWGPKDDCGLLLPAIQCWLSRGGQKRGSATSYSSLELLTQGCAPVTQVKDAINLNQGIAETKKKRCCIARTKIVWELFFRVCVLCQMEM